MSYLAKAGSILCRYTQYRSTSSFHFYRCSHTVGTDLPSSLNKQTPLSGDNALNGVERLTEAYQNHGYKIADVNPLKSPSASPISELNPALYGLNLDDEVKFRENAKVCVQGIVDNLHLTYCGHMSLETSSVESSSEKEWIHSLFSEVQSRILDDETKKEICRLLMNSQNFDKFLDAKFRTLKRYSCEGAESLLTFSQQVFDSLSSSGVQQLIVGMAHRGRNNILEGPLKYPLKIMFRKIKGLSEFPHGALSIATGDVLSHLGTSIDLEMKEGRQLHVNLLCNSSFLESVNPVATGKCRARQQTLGESNNGDLTLNRGDTAACLLMHGDASIAGQGIIMECFNMSKLPHFDVGGIIHLIVNNQLGFTTTPTYSRSSGNASDIGKLIGCPVIRVNGDNPEEVYKAAEIAVRYRQEFKKDITVDLMCFRRWGHNEMDDPTFTQPHMYNIIHNRLSVPDLYVGKLTKSGILKENEVDEWKKIDTDYFNEELKSSEMHAPEPSYLDATSSWGKMVIPDVDHVTAWDTGCHADELRYIGAKSVHAKGEFKIHNHLQKSHVETRMDKLKSTSEIDWALAETFAFGSLLNQGYDVRLCGQDVGRGTFSHRHLALTCQDSESLLYPLNHLRKNQTAKMEIVSSPLSEEAVLGFEYGMSIESPNRLIVWEAQFGDFFTGAQIIIDTYVTSGEAKWMYQSGLVILLPHGYDGAGPEHSSCRIERFLQATDSNENKVDGDGVNISVCNPTTAAQYFHLLRRQMVRNFRKPLIVASPKILLRYRPAASPLNDFTTGTRFYSVIGDKAVKDPQSVKKVIICCGKHFYALDQERSKLIASGSCSESEIAIVRIEELCPFPTCELHNDLGKYSSATNFIWSQEEPQNMGAWSFIAPRFENLLGIKLRYAGRPPLSAVAVGIGNLHQQQIKQMMTDTFM